MLFVVTIAILVSLVLTPLCGAIAWRLRAVSQPDGHRKLHCRPTPLGGGVAVYLAILGGTIASAAMASGANGPLLLPAALAVSAGMLCLLGCCDDLLDIRAPWKLLGQALATLPVVVAGCHVEQLAVMGYRIDLGWLGAVWTVGWLVAGINALNLLDGMDGLASIIGMMISLSIAVIAATAGLPQVTVLALVVAAAIAGFLVFNLPTARVYLGDCGSTVIGLAVSLLALRVCVEAPATLNLTAAVALMFVPLTDTVLAILRRTLQGRNFMVADRSHVHHRLLDRGFGQWQVLGLLCGFCLVTQTVGCWAAVSGNEFWAWAVLGTLTVVLVRWRLIGYEEWELLKRRTAQTAILIARLTSRGRLWRRLHAGEPTSVAAPESRRADLRIAGVDHFVAEAGEGHPRAEAGELVSDGRKAA